jgi:phospholipase A-2-activating protein
LVWTAAHCPNGDVVFGSDDSIARVFTRDPSRAAAAEPTAHFEESVQAFNTARQAQQIGDLDKSQLRGREALATPGQRDGQHLMINHNGKVEAYEWKGEWVFTGEVTVAIDAKVDFTFDVELDGRSLKLSHNRTDNPYESAQRFIDSNDISQSFLQEITDFIIQNADTPVLEAGGQAAAMMANPDPFTGELKAAPVALFPNVVRVMFDGGQVAAMFSKLKELNGATSEAQRASAAELAALEAALPFIQTKLSVSDAHLDATVAVLMKALQWPAE